MRKGDWGSATLGDLCSDVTSGATPQSGNSRYYREGAGTLFAKIEDLTAANGSYLDETTLRVTKAALRESALKVYPPGTILISMYGTVGLVKIARYSISANQALAALIPPFKCHEKFLYHYLNWSRGDWGKYKAQTTQANINGAIVKRRVINLPTANEQRRIAEILDTLDQAISSLRLSANKYAQIRLAHVRDLMAEGLRVLQSFEASELGSLESRGRGPWVLAPLGRALIKIEAGNSPSVEDTPAGPGEWGVLKVSAIGRNGFRPEENKVARDRSLQIKELCVRSGDLLITRANTAELVGMACIVDETPPGLMLCDKTLRLRVDDDFSSREYVHLILAIAEVRRQIEIAATGTSGSMKNISQASIRRLMIPWSDRERMDHVVRIDAGYAAQVNALMRKARHLTLLKQGLMEDLLTGRVRVAEAETVLENL
ncbi:restriction endonuclease subunit S [Microtetraspora glauca]|uniref:Restriction endonuclease subunit S n=1 Tax=Microtetraspora glauca TaxID=1996 RepID=A0ABV3GTL0_MICGL